MVFECIYKTNGRIDKWIGTIEQLKSYGGHYEMVIESRSRIYVLLGKTMLGSFACMPDYGAGCHLGKLNDVSWNKDELIHILGKIDGITVAAAFNLLVLLIESRFCWHLFMFIRSI